MRRKQSCFRLLRGGKTDNDCTLTDKRVLMRNQKFQKVNVAAKKFDPHPQPTPPTDGGRCFCDMKEGCKVS